MAGHPKQFVLYKDQAGEYRWKLYAANSKIVADSGEGCKRKEDALNGMRLVASTAANCQVNDKEKGEFYDL